MDTDNLKSLIAALNNTKKVESTLESGIEKDELALKLLEKADKKRRAEIARFKAIKPKLQSAIENKKKIVKNAALYKGRAIDMYKAMMNEVNLNVPDEIGQKLLK